MKVSSQKIVHLHSNVCIHHCITCDTFVLRIAILFSLNLAWTIIIIQEFPYTKDDPHLFTTVLNIIYFHNSVGFSLFWLHTHLLVGWLVGCIEDLRRFSVISVISNCNQEITNRWNSSGESRYRIPNILLRKPRAEPIDHCRSHTPSYYISISLYEYIIFYWISLIVTDFDSMSIR